MTPTPAFPNQNEATAKSFPVPRSATVRTVPEASIQTPAPADVTVVRAGPSTTTVNEMSDATNFGRYELVGELARGGMGVVYRARQHGLERLVALKMILGTGTDKETAQRFLQEARAAAALDHPNVVPIYDIGENAGRPYFTMALVEGPNLRGYVDQNGPLPIPAVVSLFAQVVAGVAHAHAAGIIHRDLKPANVLMDKDGRPRVTDFGLAKHTSADLNLTATGQVVGTPSYMAPEQARDSKDVGPPADVYALGAILYFLLTGRPPFVGESFTDLLIKVVSDTPAPPREFRADVPPELEAICTRCLAKPPGDRYANAQALAEALVPITDEYVPSSSGLTPSLARITLSKGSLRTTRTLPNTGTPSSSTPAPTGSGPALTNSITASLPQLPVSAPVPEPAPGLVPVSVPTIALSSAPPGAVAAPKRGRLAIGLAVVAAGLVGVIAFLATRDKKKDDVAKQDIPVVTAGPEVPAPSVPAPDVRPAPPAPQDGDKLVWPAPTRADFGLKLELVAPAAKQDADGKVLLTAGTTMQIHLKAERDCHVSVWFLDPTGQVTRLFPNDDDRDDRVTAGKERIVPGNSDYALETTATDAGGIDRLRVIATTGDAPVLPPGAKAGRFTVFTGPESERLASAVRGVVVKKAAPAGAPAALVAETEIRFRVQK